MAGVAVAFLGQVGGGGTYLGRVGRVGQVGRVGRRDGWVLAGRPTCLTCPTCPIKAPPCPTCPIKAPPFPSCGFGFRGLGKKGYLCSEGRGVFWIGNH